MILLKLLTICLVFCYAIPSAKSNIDSSDNNSTTDAPTQPKTSDHTNSARGFSRDCSKLYSITCLKLDVISFVERLSENDNYTLLPGVNVIREAEINDIKTSDLVAELARDFPNDAEARLDAFLMKKIEGYLRTHSIRFKLLDNKDSHIESARGGGGYGGGGGGGGKKDKGGMGGLLVAGAMMKGMMMMMAMAGVAAIAGKALMASMIALVMSGIIGIKSLIGGGHKSTTYEIVSKPIYTQSHTHSSSHEDHSGYGGYGGHGRSWSKDASYLPQEQILAAQQPIKFSLPPSVYLNKMN